MQETLAENGIDEPEPDEWYPQQAYLDAFESIVDSVGSRTVTNVGKKIPENADWPPGIDSVAGGLESINEAYQMNHRNGDIGYYAFEKEGDSEGKVFCKNPYPCDFDRGIVTAVVEEFSPEDALVGVEEVSDQCRASGGNECIYQVSW
ncbi:hypothetical protein [Halorussus caseinilyticus]|uniref:4-vinyl reductase 4VR domain-containing protein n=2 Tax=Halorussus caseinilyticus TaxID=3034025 RepID=A0ABD5WM95_9EURY